MAEQADREWVIARAGVPVGPMTAFELAYLARYGHLRADDLIWRDGLDAWLPAGTVPGLLIARPAPHDGHDAPMRPVQPTAAPPAGAMPRLTDLLMQNVALRVAIRPGSVWAPPATAPSAPQALPHEDAPSGYVAGPAGVPAVDVRSRVPSRMDDGPIARADIRSGSPVEATTSAATGAATGADEAPSHPLALTTVDWSRQGTSVATAGSGGSFVERMVAQSMTHLAKAVIDTLDRFEVRTIDDLASNARLEQLAALVFLALPGSLRLLVSQTVGQRVFEGLLFAFLMELRRRVPEDRRRADLPGIIRELAASDWLPRQVDGICAAAASRLGSLSGYLAGWQGLSGLAGLPGLQRRPSPLPGPADAGGAGGADFEASSLPAVTRPARPPDPALLPAGLGVSGLAVFGA